MGLRYRLFLWVSGLFIIVSACSYLVENFVAARELKKAQQDLRKEILEISEKKRIDMQHFLATAIAEDEVKIDAILNNISSFSPQALRFGPTANNLLDGTWGDVSDLLMEYQWIDFIQNTNQTVVTAGVMPEQAVMGSVYRMDIDEDLSWVYAADALGRFRAYLGVRVPYSFVSHSSEQIVAESLEQIPGVVPSAYLLFDPDRMGQDAAKNGAPLLTQEDQKRWPPIPVRWIQGYELDLEPFVLAFQRGRELLRSKKIKPPELSDADLEKRMEEALSAQDGRLNPIPEETLLSGVVGEELTQKRFEEITLRHTQINMLWVLIAMYESGIFGKDLFAFPSPTGGTVFSRDNILGVGLSTKEILFSQRIFDDQLYYSEHPSKDVHSNLGTSLAVISPAQSDRVFLGNTAQFVINSPGEERVGYLTLGVDTNALLQKLVLAVRQTVILVHGGKPLSAYDSQGKKLIISANDGIPFAKMLAENSGIINWDHENYFFMRIQPFAGVDLHFFLLNPEEKEFALLRDLESGSTKVVDAIRLDIHIAGFVALLIAIVLLHNISRNVTEPIVQLAKATKDISEGRWDKAELSLPLQKHHDEIAVLCNSFQEMVKGLKEKEKVKAVLNKVVSKEIAEEILKGSIHLGGEEKKVTVLFADIRNFTTMTQKMPPQEVIDLLNTCMTKLSQIIDANRGVIDKYVGDEAMALFGAPVMQGEDAFNAIKSALEIIASMKEWNLERAGLGQSPIEIGIGIHTGQMLAGNMGAENRLNYTVIGSNVNLASRLCGSAKGMEILISRDTLEEPFVKERVVYEAVSSMQFKGFDHTVEVFRVLKGGKDEKNET